MRENGQKYGEEKQSTNRVKNSLRFIQHVLQLNQVHVITLQRLVVDVHLLHFGFQLFEGWLEKKAIRKSFEEKNVEENKRNEIFDRRRTSRSASSRGEGVNGFSPNRRIGTCSFSHCFSKKPALSKNYQTIHTMHPTKLPWKITIEHQAKIVTINQSINQSINRSYNQSINQSINQSFIQSINQSISQAINQSIDKEINGSIRWINRTMFPEKFLHCMRTEWERRITTWLLFYENNGTYAESVQCRRSAEPHWRTFAGKRLYLRSTRGKVKRNCGQISVQHKKNMEA